MLWVKTSDGHVRQLMLAPKSVAEFYADLFVVLGELGLKLHINMMPSEIADCVPFDQDLTHASYDRDYANRFWRILLSSYSVLTLFRTAFLGKVSPVHFFWGSFDLAVTRFSGRRAPPHPGGHPASARRGRSRGLLTRGVERRILAGQRQARAGCGILLIRLSRPDGLWLGGGGPNAGVLFPAARRIHSAEVCLRAHEAKLYHLGIRGHVARSNLGDANEKRDWRIYRDFANSLIAQARRLYADDAFAVEPVRRYGEMVVLRQHSPKQ